MITVIIPALNECATIGNVVRQAKRSAKVSEVIVVDDGSVDGTPELAADEGAKVITSTFLGKGASMQDGALAAANETLLFVDGDLSEFACDLPDRMTQPVLTNDADLVKARFTRSGGRVTELSAKPLLQMFFPELLHIDQPLGGIIATRKQLVTSLKLENDYGVDVGLLIDMFAKRARICEVDIGFIEHDSQPLVNLRRMASQVIRTILDRARRFGRLTESQIRTANEDERLASADLQSIIQKLGKPTKLALIDMDGTLIKGRFVEAIAKALAKESCLTNLLDNPIMQPRDRTQKIAALLQGAPQELLQQVAMNMPLVNGAVELVVGLRKRGYAVGIVSDSFYVATEVVRKRVFGDFSLAHLLRFDDGKATGDVTICPSMQHQYGCKAHSICKQNVLLHLSQLYGNMPKTIAVGDNDGDACLLQAADVGIAFEPKTRRTANSASHVVKRNLALALSCIDREFSAFNSQWSAPYYAARLASDGL